MTSLKDVANEIQGSSAPAKAKAAPKKATVSRPKKAIGEKTKFSKTDAAFIHKHLVEPMIDRKLKTDPAVAEAARLRRIVLRYYEKFAGAAPGNAAACKKFLDSASLEMLQEELKRCQYLVAAPFSAKICDVFVHKMMEALEEVAAHFVPGGDSIKGTTREMKERGDLEVEIEEISILWEDWLARGPYGRIIIKYIEAASLHAVRHNTDLYSQFRVPEDYLPEEEDEEEDVKGKAKLLK